MVTLPINDRVVLRGDRDDNAVVCTKDTTFELKVAETSNTLLLTPSLSNPNTPGMHVFWMQLIIK